MSLNDKIASDISVLLSTNSSLESLNAALRLLSKHRCLVIQDALLKEYGSVVQSGPFKGMNLLPHSTEGCYIPKLLGSYEAQLHPFLDNVPVAEYDTIVNVGCAEGYYAVGMKRLSPESRVVAYDIDPTAREHCRDMAKLNGLEIEVETELKPTDLASFGNQRTLIWCDIEGAEYDLLDTAGAPALKRMDIVVESHRVDGRQTHEQIIPRFSSSHDMEFINSAGQMSELPPLLQEMGHLDQLLAQWEWRSSPTPWVIMKTKSRPAGGNAHIS